MMLSAGFPAPGPRIWGQQDGFAEAILDGSALAVGT